MEVNSLNKVLQREDVKKYIIALKEKSSYSDIDGENKDLFGKKYLLFLYIDAIFKYLVIIENTEKIDTYLNNLNILFDKMTTYNDIENGVYTLIAKSVQKELEIGDINKSLSRDKILRYIYNKYVVEGYFYYGFSSNYIEFIRDYGIRKEGFSIDENIKNINNIFIKHKTSPICEKESSITDYFQLSLYFSFIGPDFLEKMITNNIFKNGNYDDSFYYTKDINTLYNNIDIYGKEKFLSSNEVNELKESFKSLWNKFFINDSHPSIALIKRNSLNKNYLKDIDEIINDKKIKLINAISMILEPRYVSYDIDSDITNFDIITIPSYNDLTKNNIELLDDNKEKNEDENKNELGFGKVLTFVGIIFITLGIIILFIYTRR